MQLMRITQLEVKEEWSKVKEKKECPKTVGLQELVIRAVKT